MENAHVTEMVKKEWHRTRLVPGEIPADGDDESVLVVVESERYDNSPVSVLTSEMNLSFALQVEVHHEEEQGAGEDGTRAEDRERILAFNFLKNRLPVAMREGDRRIDVQLIEIADFEKLAMSCTVKEVKTYDMLEELDGEMREGEGMARAAEDHRDFGMRSVALVYESVQNVMNLFGAAAVFLWDDTTPCSLALVPVGDPESMHCRTVQHGVELRADSLTPAIISDGGSRERGPARHTMMSRRARTVDVLRREEFEEEGGEGSAGRRPTAVNGSVDMTLVIESRVLSGEEEEFGFPLGEGKLFSAEPPGAGEEIEFWKASARSADGDFISEHSYSYKYGMIEGVLGGDEEEIIEKEANDWFNFSILSFDKYLSLD